jgi:chromosome segregation ATPase
MDIFNKLVKKTQKSDRESELEIEVDNLRQKLEALKQTHEFSVKMIEDSKKADNNLLTSYNRLKSQFQELAKTLTIKKSTEFESLLKQQEEISRKKDELDRREAKIRDAEKELDDKIFVLQEIHSGKR